MPQTKSSVSREQGGGEGFVISRRTFLGVVGGLAAVGALASTIKWPSLSSINSSDIEEGVYEDKSIPTSCLNCPTRCAINVRVVNGKAVKISGNAHSSYSEGKVCSRAHIGLQVLYNPARIGVPLKRRDPATKGRDHGPASPSAWRDYFAPVSWEQALDEVASELGGLSPQEILFVEGLNITSNEHLIHRFAKALDGSHLLAEDAIDIAADMEGKQKSDGGWNGGYDLGNANYILAFGADIIESARPLARNLHMWGKMRRGRPVRAKVVVISPRYSVTAAKADEWVPINPGTEGLLALSMAHVIVGDGLHNAAFVNSHCANFGAYETYVTNAGFSPSSVADRVGIDAATIERLAREFAQTPPAIAWSGSGATAWSHGTYASNAIYSLNALVGSMDATGGVVDQPSPAYRDMPALAGADPEVKFEDVAKNVLGSNSVYGAAIGFCSNLIMQVPNPSEWDEGLKRIPYYVHVGPAWNEMTKYADIILPACTYLEEWGYESAIPGSGVAEARIKQPVVSVQDESRPVGDILFSLASLMSSPVRDAFKNIGGDAEGFVKFRTGPLLAWDSFRSKGVWEGPAYTPGTYQFGTGSGKFEFLSNELDDVKSPVFQGSEATYPIKLITYCPVLMIGDMCQNYAWAQEMYLVMQGRGWENYVEMGRETAHELKISDGDRVRVSSEAGEVRAKVKVLEGMRPGVVAIAAGQGHYFSGEWADGKGVNPLEVIMHDYDGESGQPALLSTRVAITKA